MCVPKFLYSSKGTSTSVGEAKPEAQAIGSRLDVVSCSKEQGKTS